MNVNVNNALSELYTDTAQFEVIKFKVILIITSVFSAFAFMLGFYLIFKKDNYVQIQGTIVSKTFCSGTPVPNQPSECSFVVSYIVNGKSYTNSINLNSSYKQSDIVNIQYDMTNPVNIRKPQMKTIYIGFILFGFALVFLGAAYYNYYMSSRSKLYAAASGVVDASNFVRNL